MILPVRPGTEELAAGVLACCYAGFAAPSTVPRGSGGPGCDRQRRFQGGSPDMSLAVSGSGFVSWAWTAWWLVIAVDPSNGVVPRMH